MMTYKELTYLESTGTQYIDTGYIPTANTSFELSGVDMDYHAGTTRFGSRVDTLKENYCFTVINGDLFRFSYGSGQKKAAEYIFNTQQLAKQVSYDASTKICMITFNDDTTESSAALIATPLTSAAKSIYLFAFNNNDSPVFGISKQTGLKIYEEGVLVRDYIPVLDLNNTPAMYDKVNNILRYNQGAGQFLYGVKETESSIQMRRKFNMLLASHKPDGYTQLKYIESSGTQYIVTPVTFSGDNYRIECGYDNTDAPSDTTPFGYQNTESGIQIMVIGFNNSNSTGTLFWNGTGTAHTNRARLNAFTKGLNRLDIKANNGTITYSVNGDTPISYSATTSFSPQTGNVWLFGKNRQSIGGSHQLVTMKFYYLRIYKNGDIVYNFIPVLDKDGVPCVLETVSKKFYYNSGTGTFAYEEWYLTPCDYVYADGNAYTNTLLYGNSDTKMEMTFDIAAQASSNTGSMGSRISANSQLLAIGYGGSTLAADFNNSSYRPYRASVIYETNKKYIAYTSKEKRSIVDGETGVVLDENNTLCTDTLSTGVLLLGAETGISDKHNGKIYGAKIWEGNSLIRDYIPAIDENNRAGLYDKDLNTMFYSDGTSDFVGHFIENGVDYKVVKNIIAEQVETSTSTNACPYIDTGLFPSTNAKTRLKCKASLSVATTSYEHYLGGVNAGSRFVIGQAGGSSGSKFYFGLGTKNFWTTMDVDTDTHIFELDWETETCSIDDTTWQIPSAGTSESSKPFFINARNTAVYANANRPAGGTSCWWKFWEGKKLVYNGIPVIRTNDNKAGLFETVNREFQTTAGTVEYTYTE